MANIYYGTDAQGNPVYESSTYQPVNSTTLQPGSTVQMPAPPQPTDVMGMYHAGNATVAANGASIAPPSPESQSTDLFSKYLGSLSAPPSAADTYASDYANSGISGLQANANTDIAALNTAQQNLAGINAQLAGLNAQGQAMNLQQEGRQAPQFQISGQQQANDRAIAIKALPLQAQALAAQAQVAAAQGKAQLSQSILNQAQQHLDTIYQIHVQDAQAQYNYRKSVIQSVYDFANKQEQRQLDAQQKASDRAFQVQMENLSNKHAQDRILLENSLKKTIPEAPTVKSINGVDMQWNPATGQWETPSSATSASGANEQSQKALDNLSFLKSTVAEAQKLAEASGPSAVTRILGDTFVGDTKFRQLEAQTNTLRTNVLTLMTDPSVKKFFGPQMSNADVTLMTAAGTTLNPQAMSPTQMRTELTRLSNLFDRMQRAVETGLGQTGGVKEGDIHVYQGTTYKVVGGQWTPQ